MDVIKYIIKFSTSFLLMVGMFVNVACYSKSNKEVTLQYLPFEDETNEPVGLHNLKKQADCTIKLDKHDKRLKEIIHTIEHNKDYDGFDYLFVRGKISNLVDGDIFFDKHNGILITNSYDAYVLTDKGFKKFKSLIISIVKEYKHSNCRWL